MSIAGTPVGTPTTYRGRSIVVSYYGPDFLSYVDGRQVGEFWLTPGAAECAAQDHINRTIDEASK